MKPQTLLLTGGAIFALFLYLIFSRTAADTAAPPPAHLAMVIDNSTSQSLNCDALPELALGALSDMRIGKRSRLSVFTLGSAASSWEPVIVVDEAAPRKGGSTFAGSFAADLTRACAGFPQVTASSIYRAVQVALGHLHGEGCGAGAGPCKLLVESDAEENVTRSFYKTGKAGQGTPLDNNGVNVIWCGYAVTEGGGGPRGEQTDALLQRWRQSFSNPDVVFKPYCKAEGVSPAPAVQ